MTAFQWQLESSIEPVSNQKEMWFGNLQCKQYGTTSDITSLISYLSDTYEADAEHAIWSWMQTINHYVCVSHIS